MKSVAKILFVVIALAIVSSCKKKDQGNDIIVDRVIEKPQEEAVSMSDDVRSGSVAWVNGSEYSYTITRKTDSELPTVNNHGTVYKDNSITLVVKRADGSVFFEKKFTKDNFAPALPKDFKENGVLLGMNLSKAEGNNLCFAVSVGSPDENNEEFYYVQMTLNNFGQTSCSEYRDEERLKRE